MLQQHRNEHTLAKSGGADSEWFAAVSLNKITTVSKKPKMNEIVLYLYHRITSVNTDETSDSVARDDWRKTRDLLKTVAEGG